MKTFDEKDLITWANRDKAVIGNKYYFANIVDEIYDRIRDNDICTLIEILDENVGAPFIEPLGNYDGFGCGSACILPVDKVIDEPEKKYRACKTIKEFYEVVNNYRSDSFPINDFTYENFIYNLLNSDIHFRSKNTGTEYYSIIRSVSKDTNKCIRILMTSKSYLSFEHIFENYEIELNDTWQPFGVLDDN